MNPSQIRATLQFRSNSAVTRARNCMGRPCSFSTDLDEIKVYILIGAVQIKGDEQIWGIKQNFSMSRRYAIAFEKGTLVHLGKSNCNIKTGKKMPVSKLWKIFKRNLLSHRFQISPYATRKHENKQTWLKKILDTQWRNQLFKCWVAMGCPSAMRGCRRAEQCDGGGEGWGCWRTKFCRGRVGPKSLLRSSVHT